jgi:membrane-bound serine protease (ClpP class)
MVNNDSLDFSFVKADDLFYAVVTTLAGLIGSFMIIFVGGVRLTESKAFQRIALNDVQETNAGFSSSFYKSKLLVGKTGIAKTVLRPSGRVAIDDDIYDAYTRGEYIESGTSIEVISDEGTSLKVKSINPES